MAAFDCAKCGTFTENEGIGFFRQADAKLLCTSCAYRDPTLAWEFGTRHGFGEGSPRAIGFRPLPLTTTRASTQVSGSGTIRRHEQPPPRMRDGSRTKPATPRVQGCGGSETGCCGGLDPSDGYQALRTRSRSHLPSPCSPFPRTEATILMLRLAFPSAADTLLSSPSRKDHASRPPLLPSGSACPTISWSWRACSAPGGCRHRPRRRSALGGHPGRDRDGDLAPRDRPGIGPGLVPAGDHADGREQPVSEP